MGPAALVGWRESWLVSNERRPPDGHYMIHSQRLTSATQTPRLLAALLAFAINILLIAAVMVQDAGSRRFPTAVPEPNLVTLTINRPVTDIAAVHQVSTSHHRAAAGRRGSDLSPSLSGPPTETVASLMARLTPEIDARPLDAQRVRETCQRVYGELTSERAVAQMELRVFVTPDGRIAQGNVTDSSGDADLDWLTLKCLQIYAQLEPAPSDQFPTGSWQRLAWQWVVP